MADIELKPIVDEDPDEQEEEASYQAYLFDQYEDEDFKDYELDRDPSERMVNWDDDEYEYYDDGSQYYYIKAFGGGLTGKTPDFGSGRCRFDPYPPSHFEID